MKSIWIALSLCLVVGSGVLVYLHGSGVQSTVVASTRGVKVDSSAEPDDRKARIQELEARLRKLEAGPVKQVEKDSNSDDPIVDGGDRDLEGVVDDEPVGLALARNDEQIALVDRAFYGEAQDREWAGKTEEKIEAMLADYELGGTTLHDYECRSSFCRLEFTHEDRGGRELVESVIHHIPMGAIGIPHDEDGELRTYIYLVKPEEDRPEHPARM